MSIRVVTPPEPFVTWEQAKAHLREDSDDEKSYVEGLIAAATAWVDGPGGWVGRSFAPQLLDLRSALNCAHNKLPYGPVLEIDSIETNADDVSPVLVDPSLYTLRSDGILVIPDGAAWVSEPEHLVRYWAGYGARDEADPEVWVADVPRPVHQAVLLLVGQWFNTRSNVQIGDAVNQMPMAVEALLAPYRSWN